MQKESYIQYLSDTSEQIFPIIKKEIENIIFEEAELAKFFSFFYLKKENKLLLKPTLFRLAYEICGGTDFSKVQNIAAAFEVLNISSYQANSAFDNKMGILDKKAKDNQFIASMLSREMATKLILNEKNKLPSNAISQFINCISLSNLYIYKAQHYDLNLLSNANYERYSASEDLFREDYHNRCFFGSGIFSGQTALAGAIAANADKEKQMSLQTFGEIYGTALHKINDLADFFPGEERSDKLYQDNYSDIRNERLTFPVYKLRKYYEDKYKELLALVNNNNNADITQKVTNILSGTTLVAEVRQVAKKAFCEAKQTLMAFEISDSKKLLITLLSILDSNKFYYRANNNKNYEKVK